MIHADHHRTDAPVLGIVGGLASGKSTVAKLLAKRGARVVDADRLGHRMLELPQVRRQIVEAFGGDVLDEAGGVSRARLAERVFGHADAVERLNRIVHPPIIRGIRAQVARLSREADVPLIVLDAALLMETNLHEEMCQALLFVDAPEELRLRRALASRGMDADQFAKRQDAQLGAELKKARADHVITNSGSLEELERQIGELWPELCQIGTRVSD